MPNWCQNNISIKGSEESVNNFLKQVASDSENSCFDFNKLIKMPESLNIEASSTGEQAHAVFYGKKENLKNVFYLCEEELNKKVEEIKSSEKSKQIADIYENNIQQYDAKTWYEWCPKNWGTKWNACNPSQSEIKKHDDGLIEAIINFETAWSYPSKVYEKIAEKYPDLIFSIELDEEGGYFWGNITINKGNIIDNLQEGVRPGGKYDYSDEDDNY